MAGRDGKRAGVARLQRRLRFGADAQGSRAGPAGLAEFASGHADGRSGAPAVPTASAGRQWPAGLFQHREPVPSTGRRRQITMTSILLLKLFLVPALIDSVTLAGRKWGAGVA